MKKLLVLLALLFVGVPAGAQGVYIVGVGTATPVTTTLPVSGTVSAIESGTWNIATLTSITNPVAVTGTFWQTTQPVSGTFWQTTQPVSGSVTAAQTTAANLNATVVGTGTFATQSAVTAASGSIASGAVASGAYASGSIASGAFGSDSASFGVGATGSAPPAKANYIGGLGSGATGGFLIGPAVGDTYKNINISTGATTLLVTGVSGRQVHVTAISLVTAAANNVAFISGTGASCGTGTGAIVGTTAATGYNFAANGGLTMGNGIGTVLMTVAAGDSICAVTSASTQLSGSLMYAIY